MAITSCAGGQSTSPAGVSTGPAPIAPDALGPLTGLGPCNYDAGEPVDASAVDDLIVPPSTIISRIEPNGPLTQVQGYLEMTPVQLRAWYRDHPAVEELQSEDEGFESEILVESGEHRLFVKASAVCEQGSVFVAVIAPTSEQGGVPTPAGGGGGTP